MVNNTDGLTEDTKSFLALSKILDNLVLGSNLVDVSFVELKILVQVKITEGVKVSETNWISQLTEPEIEKALKKLLGEGFWNRNRTPLLERIDEKLYLTKQGVLFLDGLLISNSGQISASNPGLVKIRISEDFSLLHKQESKNPNNSQLFFDRINSQLFFDHIRSMWLDSTANEHQIMGHLIADHCLRACWAEFINDDSFVMDLAQEILATDFYALLDIIGYGVSKKELNTHEAFGVILTSLKDIHTYFKSKTKLDAYENGVFERVFGCSNEKELSSEDSMRRLSIKITNYQAIVGCNLEFLDYSTLSSDLRKVLDSKANNGLNL